MGASSPEKNAESMIINARADMPNMKKNVFPLIRHYMGRQAKENEPPTCGKVNTNEYEFYFCQ